jgi:hypothetical protein
MAKVEIPDVNVLIALFDSENIHHDAAQQMRRSYTIFPPS